MVIEHAGSLCSPNQREGSISDQGRICEFQDEQDDSRTKAVVKGSNFDVYVVRDHAVGMECESKESSCIVRSVMLPQAASISHRRGIDLNIPRFNQVVGAPLCATESRASNRLYRYSNRSGALAETPSQIIHPQLVRTHSLGPLTPPHDVEVRWCPKDSITRIPIEAAHDSSDHTPSKENLRETLKGLSLSQTTVSQMQSDIQIPLQGSSCLPWLDQALKSINWSSEMLPNSQYIEFVSQVLPNHASDRRLVKTSEIICQHLQQALRDLQGITITHAITVPQSQVVEDFPKSPPTTPNFMVRNGYFDEPIIVTKAANVPVYHALPGRVQQLGLQIQRRIMVRSVVDIALLERWIPPTTGDEIADFFNADSFRSYLADRLSELSIGTGSLLLIYPTRSGGQTFARKYIAPILDPLLREMSILRGLDTDAAQKLGSMDAIESMLEFDRMKSKIENLCTNMSERSRALTVSSSYNLVHCEAVEIVLDRPTWMTWFVEQEQLRLKQNLIDYHKDGGRLPEGDGGSSELTAGMLTREIIEGLQKSKNEAGNAGIEVGMFVIQRARGPR